MKLTTLCLPELPADAPYPESDAVAVASAEAVLLEPILEQRVALALDALCAALLDGHVATDTPDRQRHVAHLLRGALLGRPQIPAWLFRRARLHEEKWVRDWIERAIPLGPLAGGYLIKED
jgi:hypothetical protein